LKSLQLDYKLKWLQLEKP